MPAPVPTLGYRSKSEAVKALTQKGLRPKDIAPMIGLTPQQVYNLTPRDRSFREQKVERSRKRSDIHWPDAANAPQGPFTYAKARPSSLIDEIAARAAARPVRRDFRLLLRADGAWLDEDGLGFVFDRDKAGRFTAAEIARMRARNPARRDLREERA